MYNVYRGGICVRATSLVFPIYADGKVLLGRKKRGMGFGKWNGFGGKIEDGETMRECAVRELYEECGISAAAEDLAFVADIYFDQPSDRSWSHPGAIYFLRKWKGTFTPSDEMEPRVFSLEDFPYDEMWQADKIWLPMIFSGRTVKGLITFDSDGSTVLSYSFEDAILSDDDKRYDCK